MQHNTLMAGWNMAPKKPTFLGFLKKPLKTSKVQNLLFLIYFFVKFYTDHIKFHILIVICEFCCILQKML